MYFTHKKRYNNIYIGMHECYEVLLILFDMVFKHMLIFLEVSTYLYTKNKKKKTTDTHIQNNKQQQNLIRKFKKYNDC